MDKFPLKWYSVINLLIAVALITDGLYWIAKVYYPFTPTLLWQMFSGPPADATPLLVAQQSIVFFLYGPRFIPILPISILLLGLLMVGLDRTNPKIAVPLWLMACGAFDVIGNANVVGRLSDDTFWMLFQLCLMSGGWVLAGFPRFKANGWLALLIGTYVLTYGPVFGGRPYEIALFSYIITSTVPNLWGRPSGSKSVGSKPAGASSTSPSSSASSPPPRSPGATSTRSTTSSPAWWSMRPSPSPSVRSSLLPSSATCTGNTRTPRTSSRLTSRSWMSSGG